MEQKACSKCPTTWYGVNTPNECPQCGTTVDQRSVNMSEKTCERCGESFINGGHACELRHLRNTVDHLEREVDKYEKALFHLGYVLHHPIERDLCWCDMRNALHSTGCVLARDAMALSANRRAGQERFVALQESVLEELTKDAGE